MAFSSSIGTYVPQGALWGGVAAAAQNDRERRIWLIKVVTAALVFSVLVFKLWVRVAIMDSSYEVAQLQQAALQKDADIRELSLQREYLLRPQEITFRAEALGMTLLTPQRIRQIH